MTRLPHPGKDEDAWGRILNDFLRQAHNDDGTLKDDVVTSTQIAALGGHDGQVLAKDSTSVTGLAWKNINGVLDAASHAVSGPSVITPPVEEGDIAISSVPGRNQVMLANTTTPVVTASLDPAPPSGPAGGDLAGVYPDPQVVKVNGVAVANTPVAGQVLTATDAANATWVALPQARMLYVEDFRGANNNDVQTIQAAMQAVQSGDRLVFEERRTYTFSTGVVFPSLEGKSCVTIDGNGATFDFTAVTGLCCAIGGGFLAQVTTVTASIAKGATAMTVASSSNLRVGDIVEIFSSGEVFDPDRAPASGIKGELARISAINGTTVSFANAMYDSYSTSGYTVYVTRVMPVTGLVLENLTVKGRGAGGINTGLRVQNFDGATVRHCNFVATETIGLAVISGYNATVERCRSTDCCRDGLGYGYQVTSCDGAVLRDCVGVRNRHSFDAGPTVHTPSRNVTYDSCTAIGDISAGISTHTTDIVLIQNCTALNCGGGIVSRGRRTKIVRNKVIGVTNTSAQSYQHGIRVGDEAATRGAGAGGIQLEVLDNEVDITGASAGAHGFFSTAGLVDVRIARNTFRGFTAQGVYAGGGYARNLVIEENTIDCSGQIGAPGDPNNALFNGIFVNPGTPVANNPSGQAQNLFDIRLTRNRISAPLYSAIRLGSPDASAASDHIDICDNSIGGLRNANNVAGINLTATGLLGADVRVHDNRFSDQWLSMSRAVTVPASGSTCLVDWVKVYSNSLPQYTAAILEPGIERALRGPRPNLWYAPDGYIGSTATLVQNQECAIPFFVGRWCTLTGLAVANIVTAMAGSTIRLGVRADAKDTYGSYPGALVIDAGTVAATATGFRATSTLSQVLAPGLYWLTATAQGGTPSVTAYTGTVSQIVGYQGAGNVAGRAHYVQSSVSGALPAVFSSSTNAQGATPVIQARFN